MNPVFGAGSHGGPRRAERAKQILSTGQGLQGISSGRAAWMAGVVMLAVVAGILLLASFPAEVLVVLTLLYLALIPVAWRRFKALEAADAQAAALAPAGAEAPGPADQGRA